jgi:hypothetical protein
MMVIWSMGAIFTTIFLFSHYASADNPGQLGMKMIPGIITQDTEGIIQVYSKSGGTLDNLVSTSYDPTIVQITGMDQDKSHHLYLVKIKTIKYGQTTIAFAAPGFSGVEFPIVVTKNTNIASKLLIKITPNTFSTNGPTHGYFAVETVNEDNFPTAVSADTTINITSSDTNIVSLKDDKVVIKNGSYYATGQFDASQHGLAQISAYSPTMQTVSSPVTVNTVNSQETLQAYVYPPEINSAQAATVFAIVQLHDSNGNPILAKEDIPVSIRVANSSGVGSINTSGNTYYVQANEAPVIKKGTYWAEVPVELASGTVNKFNVTVSSKGYLSTIANFTSFMNSTLYDDKSVKIDTLPILATGGRELIGIAHIQDINGVYLLAPRGMKVSIDSSDPSTVSVEDVAFDLGSESAPIYAKVGNVVNPVTLHVVTSTPQTVTPTISPENQDLLNLVGEPLIPKVLSNSVFPFSLYVLDQGMSALPKNPFDVQISPTDVIQAPPISFNTDSSIQITSAKLLQSGSQIVSLTGSTAYAMNSTINALSSYANSVSLDSPDSLVANVPSVFSVELLDDQKLPVYADHDIDVKLVSNDPSVIDFPDVQIKKGTYYTQFEGQAKKGGYADISILADMIPLSKFTLYTVGFTPTISIQSPDFAGLTLPFVATITVMNNQSPLGGLPVVWGADGATIQKMDSTTSPDGTATATFVSSNPGTVHIKATVSGGTDGDTVATKDITVNPPLSSSNGTPVPQTSSTSFSILGISPIFLIIPVVAGVLVFMFFKKRNLLEGLTGRISINDEMSAMREKIMNLRQSD